MLAASAVLLLGAGAGVAWAAFSATTSSPASFSAASDLTAPAISRSTIAKSGSTAGGTVGPGDDYYVYAQVTDSGSPPTGMATVTADTSSVDAGVSAAPLTSSGGPWTIGEQTYNYRSAVLTADTPRAAGSYPYSVSAADAAGNTATQSFTVTVETYDSMIRSTSSLVSFWRLGDTSASVTSDTFTDSAGALLANHSGDLGATWSGYGTNSGAAVVTDQNRVRRGVSGQAMYYASSVPASANYSVEADVHVKSLLSSDAVGVIGRASTSAETYYVARYRVATGVAQWELLRVVNATATTLATYAQTLTTGSTYRLKLDMQGSTITLLVDGAPRFSVSDPGITSPGRGGLRLGNATTTPTDTTGLHLDNLTITSSPPSAADSNGTNTGTYTNGVMLGTAGALVGDTNAAAKLDGVEDYMRVASPSGFPTGAATRSVELWFKTTTSSLRQTLFHYGSQASGQEFGLFTDGSTKLYTWAYGIGNDFTWNTASSITDGSWHHVVVTYNGSAVLVYVDGSALGSARTVALNTAINSYGLVVGTTLAPGDGNDGLFFNGSVDAMAIYSAALSPSTILSHYQAGHGS
jgi:hypothetical protein